MASELELDETALPRRRPTSTSQVRWSWFETAVVHAAKLILRIYTGGQLNFLPVSEFFRWGMPLSSFAQPTERILTYNDREVLQLGSIVLPLQTNGLLLPTRFEVVEGPKSPTAVQYRYWTAVGDFGPFKLRCFCIYGEKSSLWSLLCCACWVQSVKC
jgi:hypothetical protein